MRGFESAAQLVAQRVRAAGESRGFAVARLLTHWQEVVGPEIALHARPVKVSHGKGFGATLTLLVPGARAPLIEMQLPRIRDKVNACYGFNAVARIVLTQTAPTGFAEGQTPFTAAPPRKPAPDPARIAYARNQAEDIASGFDNPALAAAMRQMALNILSRADNNDRKANP
ncbi:Zn-ribbon-containing, possibly RNA-binding protein [Paracoccus halophilus]|nr:Zn-ribbon-containing, possibly RNA-binding protein [Paracoccus halophilus]